MNILLLTPQPPYPPIQGAAIRNYQVLRHLAERHRVWLATFVPSGSSPDLGDLPALCASVTTVPAPVRTKSERLRAMLASSLPDMALRLHSTEFCRQVSHLMVSQRFDVVHVEGIEMAHYGLALSAADGQKPRTIFEDHNAEYVLQRRAFETDVRVPRRWVQAGYSLVQWRRLRRYERGVISSYDRVIAVSDADRRALQVLVPGLDVAVIPNCVDTESFAAGASSEELPDLIFVGTMDYRPNVDAVLWFVRAVMPLLWSRKPDLRFWIVGLRPTAAVRRLGTDRRIVVTGGVPDVRPLLAAHGVCVVPMRVGGGTRIKVLEAMAMAKGIVSTTFGCEGLGVEDGRHVLLADGPTQFAAKCLRLLEDPQERLRLGFEARRFVRERFDWRVVTPLLSRVYESLALESRVQ